MGVQERGAHTPSQTTLLGTQARPSPPQVAIFQKRQLSQCIRLSAPAGTSRIAVREVGIVQGGRSNQRERGFLGSRGTGPARYL